MLFFEFINLLEGFLTQLRKADNAIHYINLYPVDYAIVSLILIHILVRVKEIKFSLCYLTPLPVHKMELISIPSKIHFISEPVHWLKVVL